ncbi:hypothetical protein GCM10020219_028710 [Nonomuraea dietziae]
MMIGVPDLPGQTTAMSLAAPYAELVPVLVAMAQLFGRPARMRASPVLLPISQGV